MLFRSHSGEIVADTAAMQAPPPRQDLPAEAAADSDYAEYDNTEPYQPEEQAAAEALGEAPPAYTGHECTGRYEPPERTVGEALAVEPEAYEDNDYDMYDDYEDITGDYQPEGQYDGEEDY